jgi:predicted nucleic acid-binding protein
VINASPLIFLGNAGHLKLLRLVAPGRVVVPEVVWNEVTNSPHLDRAAHELPAADWLERMPVPAIPSSVIEWDLDPGEASVIATGLALNASRVVIDDLTGRKCALSHGLPLGGTLGVVIAARRAGHVASASATLHELRAVGLWLADDVIARALQLAGID